MAGIFSFTQDETIFDVSYEGDRDRVCWFYQGVFDHATWEQFTWGGACRGEEWLQAVGSVWNNTAKLGGVVTDDPCEVVGFIRSLTGAAPLADMFLDSFSIIENGETSKRSSRMIEPSPAQKALLGLANSGGLDIATLGPREFEAFVARVLSEMGFAKVELRRYVKDLGVDVIAILADGPHPETVVIEVKHTVGTLAAMDRLFGVKYRDAASLALLVSSCHITRDARTRYASFSNEISSKTIAELLAILRDAPDWSSTARQLWTKK